MRSLFPFPLPVHSSHHSGYHRFLLGADPAILAPFPKPYCMGALKESVGALANNLTLPGWRKLYNASIPWIEGFAPDHYDLGKIPAHRAIPKAYGRPVRRFGAYDFVQVADPSVSALGLVAGDRRVVDRFISLSESFGAHLEEGASSLSGSSVRTRITGRMLAGQFAEPNNRWLMPFLHVHTRVLNFTSFKETPQRLLCIDSAALAQAGARAKRAWIDLQRDALSDLGYRVSSVGEGQPSLQVEGVSSRLLATLEAPRIAVLKILERMIVGGSAEPTVDLGSELPKEVIAVLAEQVEAALVHSLSLYKPAKIGLPSEGPWTGAVRDHLVRHCPEALAALDLTAVRAKALLRPSALFSNPSVDCAHCHAPNPETLEAADQRPTDPDLGACRERPASEAAGYPWLVREFLATLAEVNERLVRAGLNDPYAAHRRILAEIDQLCAGVTTEQLEQSARLVQGELHRRDRPGRSVSNPQLSPFHDLRVPLMSVEELFQGVAHSGISREQEMGGRSL